MRQFSATAPFENLSLLGHTTIDSDSRVAYEEN